MSTWFHSEVWTDEKWRDHCRLQSDKYKSVNEGRDPSRRGLKLCPGCSTEKRRKEFAIAVRQPDGLRQYCHECNRLKAMLWYWQKKLGACQSQIDRKVCMNSIKNRFTEREAAQILKSLRRRAS
jgi:hypothetical protein